MRIAKAFLFTILVAFAAGAKTVEVTVLATTDMHGNLLAWDYFAGAPAARGLSKVATLIKAVRAENPNTVLADCGDTIQGAPIESVYQYYVRHGRLPLGAAPLDGMEGDPMMRAMNVLRYDAMVVGNHEFNFGLKNLSHAVQSAKFPWLSANIRKTPDGAANPEFRPYIVKDVGGVKVAIVGVTTTGIPHWDEEAHWKGYEFVSARDAAAEAVAEVRRKHHPDLVVIGAHMGLGADLKTAEPDRGSLRGENVAYEIARSVPGVDAVFFGHTHQRVEGARVGEVLLVQPKNWAASLARIDFTLRQEDGKWRVVSRNSRLIPVTRDTPEDPEIVALARPYHEAAERYLNTPVAESAAAVDTSTARVEDNALIDAIQRVQMHYSKADVSFTAAFNTRVKVPKGPVTVREIAALYLYDNTLLAVEGTGKTVREALENSARFYLSCESDCTRGPLINKAVVGFNYDIAQGVRYDVDLTRPVGQRIRNLRWKGKPLRDNQKLRIAINNYRYGGSGGFTMFKPFPVVWRSGTEIRDLIIDYYTERKRIPSSPDGNWKVVPDAARATLLREAAGTAAE